MKEVFKNKIFITLGAIIVLSFLVLFLNGKLGINLKKDESGTAKTECLEELAERDSEKIVDKINSIQNADTKESTDFKRDITDKMIRFLIHCELRVDPSEENFNRIKNLINNIQISGERTESALTEIKEAEKFYSNPGTSTSGIVNRFSKTLALKKSEFLCVENKLNPNLTEECLSQFTDKICLETCERLNRYSKDIQSFNKEINFTDWSQYGRNTYSDIMPTVNWHIAIAYRFAGESGAQKICENLPSAFKESKKDCLNVVERIKQFEKSKNDCTDLLKEITSDICEVSSGSSK